MAAMAESPMSREIYVQYATARDGMGIAYWVTGEGRPFVHMPNPPWSHSLVAWQVPEMRRWFERLLARRQMIRYDSRGSGLSDRSATDFSLDAMVGDLEALIERVDPAPFALFAYFASGPVAIAYTAKHPERVSHLILWCSYACGADYTRSAAVRATRTLMEQDWETYTETAAHVLLGWNEGEEAHRLAHYMREAVEASTAQRIFASTDEFDVTSLLGEITTPTLVLHRQQITWAEEYVPRRLAACIPSARLVLLDGSSPVPGLGDMEAVLSAVGSFLGDDFGTGSADESHGSVRTVLFTDLVGHTEMMRRLGDERGRAMLREHERITRNLLKQHGGAEVKTMGDGFMASFGSITKAVDCAIALQRAFAFHTESMPEPLQVRVGLNTGEPIDEDGDLFGSTVILASRIAAQAGAGEILIPEPLRHLLSGKSYVYADRGETMLKGFEDAVRLYEVRWRE
jgi:class 3 adenylate cyclase/pimeloyl-ACP methyl ester carboxylesterase